MEEHRIYFGKKFYSNKANKGYWLSTDGSSLYAHRWVWINYYGEIPKGMHIHHIDEDVSNNDIRNLQLMGADEHLLEHMRRKNFDKNQMTFAF